MSVDGVKWAAGWAPHSPRSPGALAAANLRSVLANHHNQKTGRCNPSRKFLAEELGRSERTLQGAIEYLRRADQIKTYRRSAQGGRQGQGWDSLAYVLTPAPGGKAPKPWVPEGSQLAKGNPRSPSPSPEEREPRTSPSYGSKSVKLPVNPTPEEREPRPVRNRKEPEGQQKKPPTNRTYEEIEEEIRQWEDAAEEVAADHEAVERRIRREGLWPEPKSEELAP